MWYLCLFNLDKNWWEIIQIFSFILTLAWGYILAGRIGSLVASSVNAKLKLSSQIWYRSPFLTSCLIFLKSQTLPFMSRDSQFHIQAAKWKGWRFKWAHAGSAVEKQLPAEMRIWCHGRNSWKICFSVSCDCQNNQTYQQVLCVILPIWIKEHHMQNRKTLNRDSSLSAEKVTVYKGQSSEYSGRKRSLYSHAELDLNLH